MPPRSSPSCFPLSTRTPRATGTSIATLWQIVYIHNLFLPLRHIFFFKKSFFLFFLWWVNSWRKKLSVQMSGVILLCFLLQDNPWAYLQCSKALYGDEPEAVWWLHSAVQGWEAEVSEQREERENMREGKGVKIVKDCSDINCLRRSCQQLSFTVSNPSELQRERQHFGHRTCPEMMSR